MRGRQLQYETATSKLLGSSKHHSTLAFYNLRSLNNNNVLSLLQKAKINEILDD